jgi:hypothetical protein
MLRYFAKLIKWGSLLILAVVLAYGSYYYYSLVTGKERMTAVCARMTPGMTLQQLAHLADEYGLGPRLPNPAAKLAYLAERRSFGRHACRVELENGIVKSATYNYAD